MGDGGHQDLSPHAESSESYEASCDGFWNSNPRFVPRDAVPQFAHMQPTFPFAPGFPTYGGPGHYPLMMIPPQMVPHHVPPQMASQQQGYCRPYSLPHLGNLPYDTHPCYMNN